MLELTTPVQYVKGVGPKLAEILATKGIATVGDLLNYLPFRYEDRLNPRGIAELRAGEMATVIAEVRTSGLFRTRRMPIPNRSRRSSRRRTDDASDGSQPAKSSLEVGMSVIAP